MNKTLCLTWLIKHWQLKDFFSSTKLLRFKKKIIGIPFCNKQNKLVGPTQWESKNSSVFWLNKKKSKITFELKSTVSFSSSSLFACLIQVVSGDSVTLTCLNSSWLCLNRCPSTCQHSPMNNVAFGWRNGKWRRPKRRQPFAMTTTSPLTITDTCGSEVLVGSPPTPAQSVRFWRKKQLIGWLTCTTAYYQVTMSKLRLYQLNSSAHLWNCSFTIDHSCHGIKWLSVKCLLKPSIEITVLGRPCQRNVYMNIYVHMYNV